MLHFDRKTQAYLNALDTNFNTTPPLSEGIAFELEKVYDSIEYEWEQQLRRVTKGMQSFDNKVKAALSVPIPARYINKKRPDTHKFPYYNSGQLVRGLEPSEVTGVWGDNSFNIKIVTGTTEEHAHKTNQNITPAGHNQRPVAWYHWADHVFGATLPANTVHKSGIPDIRAILLGYYS